MIKPHQGIFKPKNPQKYKGNNLNKIDYKSGLELRFLMYCDHHPSIVEYAYEGVIIPYIDPTSKPERIRRYFVDFWIKKKNPNGTIECNLIEIKPSIETSAPVITPKKSKPRFLKEQVTWAINTSKWRAATAYCEERNWKFIILTEAEIAGLKY